jgi:hypothetical protein
MTAYLAFGLIRLSDFHAPGVDGFGIAGAPIDIHLPHRERPIPGGLNNRDRVLLVQYDLRFVVYVGIKIGLQLLGYGCYG